MKFNLKNENQSGLQLDRSAIFNQKSCSKAVILKSNILMKLNGKKKLS